LEVGGANLRVVLLETGEEPATDTPTVAVLLWFLLVSGHALPPASCYAGTSCIDRACGRDGRRDREDKKFPLSLSIPSLIYCCEKHQLCHSVSS